MLHDKHFIGKGQYFRQNEQRFDLMCLCACAWFGDKNNKDKFC